MIIFDYIDDVEEMTQSIGKKEKCLNASHFTQNCHLEMFELFEIYVYLCNSTLGTICAIAH